MDSVAHVAILLATIASASGAPSPRFPKGTARMELGVPPAGIGTWQTERCAGCHTREAEAWASSGHAHARDGFVFRESVKSESPEWCVRCHAPLAMTFGAGPPAGGQADESGVGCAACHAGNTHSGRKSDDDGAELCGGCHEFGFAIRNASGRIERLAADPQQDTLGEWRRWRERTGDARTCVDCHMREGDHSFGGTHRADSLRESIAVEIAGRTLRVNPRNVGHALPTGDVLRWISVEASADELFGDPLVVARFGRTLALSTREGATMPWLGSATDTRLDGPVSVAIPAVDPDGRTLVAWRVVYHLVSERQEQDGTIPPGASRIVLHAGTLGEPP